MSFGDQAGSTLLESVVAFTILMLVSVMAAHCFLTADMLSGRALLVKAGSHSAAAEAERGLVPSYRNAGSLVIMADGEELAAIEAEEQGYGADGEYMRVWKTSESPDTVRSQSTDTMQAMSMYSECVELREEALESEEDPKICREEALSGHYRGRWPALSQGLSQAYRIEDYVYIQPYFYTEAAGEAGVLIWAGKEAEATGGGEEPEFIFDPESSAWYRRPEEETRDILPDIREGASSDADDILDYITGRNQDDELSSGWIKVN